MSLFFFETMKDIEIGCDSEHGGVLCNRCGDNSRNNGAVGLTHQADSLIDDSRQTLETKIYEARKFIDTVRVNQVHQQGAMDL